MNAKQKNIVIMTAAVILVMLVIPPFQYVGNGGARASAGFAFIFSDTGG